VASARDRPTRQVGAVAAASLGSRACALAMGTAIRRPGRRVRVPHIPATRSGSLGRGPLAQVRFFPFSSSLSSVFSSVINIFLFQNLTFFIKLFFKIFFQNMNIFKFNSFKI
jgi:hypothetical protein